MTNLSYTLARINIIGAIARHWWLLVVALVVAVLGVILYLNISGPAYETDVTVLVHGPYSISGLSSSRPSSDASTITQQDDFISLVNNLGVASSVERQMEGQQPAFKKMLAQGRPDLLFGSNSVPRIAVAAADTTGDVGNAASGATSSPSSGGPSTDFVTVMGVAHTEAASKALATTYANTAVGAYQQIMSGSAGNSTSVLKNAVDSAQSQLQRDENNLANFEVANNVVGGQDALVSANQQLQRLQLTAATLQGDVAGHQSAAGLVQSLNSQISSLQSSLESSAQSGGRQASTYNAHVQQLQQSVNLAQSQYAVAYQNLVAATNDVARQAAAGYRGSQTTSTTTSGNRTSTTTSTSVPTFSNQQQADAYLGSLQGIVNTDEGNYQTAQGSLASYASTDPNQANDSTLALNRGQLQTLTAERQAMMSTTDPQAELNAIDGLITQQQAQVKSLSAIMPMVQLLSQHVTNDISNVNQLQTEFDRANSFSQALRNGAEISVAQVTGTPDTFLIDNQASKLIMYAALLGLFAGALAAIILEVLLRQRDGVFGPQSTGLIALQGGVQHALPGLRAGQLVGGQRIDFSAPYDTLHVAPPHS